MTRICISHVAQGPTDVVLTSHRELLMVEAQEDMKILHLPLPVLASLYMFRLQTVPF